MDKLIADADLLIRLLGIVISYFIGREIALSCILLRDIWKNKNKFKFQLHNIDKLCDMIKYERKVPPNFNQWDLKIDKDENTIAHLAAQYSCLPSDFNQWNLSNDYGWTVAHATAIYNRLPPDFDQWSLANKCGWTVAHSAAKYGKLLPDFNQWELTDNNGRTVAQIAYEYNHLPPDFDRWNLIKKD
jgi:hypothetical protein